MPTPRDEVFENIFPRVSSDKQVVNQAGRKIDRKMC